MADPRKEVAPIAPGPVPVSLFHSLPAQRITSMLLNEKNFHAWSRSFQLYLSGKRKTHWIPGKKPEPVESNPKFDECDADNCIILCWMFNSMEDRVYHMFMYRDTVHGLWIALNQIHLIDRCFDLHPELKQQFSQNCGGGRGSGRGGSHGQGTPQIGAIAEVEPIHTDSHNFNQLQTQIAQLQSHLGLAPSSSSSGPMALGHYSYRYSYRPSW
ncbi:hypothetical protein Acr_00g0045920 [Actinidia rufa]|uniref:Retrotransposon Copia-like N-terminal domain-containing protein n=1 Tax=Actinidia rufa TaxID=165716 RepID=A0A7J0DKT2_9ERIC|nr:hypothetical protein Acr_00g0045920 [Actinidia rufa]